MGNNSVRGFSCSTSPYQRGPHGACPGPGNPVNTWPLLVQLPNPVQLNFGCRGAGVSRAGRETWGQARLGRQPRAWKHNLFLQLGPGEPEGLAWLGCSTQEPGDQRGSAGCRARVCT